MRSRSPAGESPAKPAPRRLTLALAAIAFLALGLELAWYSDPVQEWWTARQPAGQLEALAREQPGALRVRYHLAMKLLRAGRAGEAFRHAQEGSVMDPTSARLHRAAGLAARALGRPTEAEEEMGRAHALGDRSAATLLGLAELARARGAPGEAIPPLEEAVRRYPKRADLWRLLGYCRAEVGMPEGWTEAMRRATEAAPGDPLAWLDLSESWLNRERGSEALNAADRALALQPENARGWIAKGRALALPARGDAAVRDAESAFRRGLENPAAAPVDLQVGRREYGKLLLDHHRPKEAVEVLRKVAETAPGDPAAYTLALAYRRAGDTARAEEVMRRYRKRADQERELRYLAARAAVDPDNPALLRSVARALEKAGRRQEAAAYYERASVLEERTRRK